MLGRLKDQRVAVNERLTLARKLWATESEVGPNKQQIITDAVVGLLVNNKKRNDLTDAERTDTWGTLSYILKSVSNASKNGSTLAVRPLLAQVLVDTLEAFACRTEITKQSHDDTLAYVLECCSAILQSSTLSYVLTTRFEILVSLASVVCQLCVSLPQTLNSSLDLSLLLSQATSHLQQTSHRCQLSPSQVLHTVIDRLLQPAVLLAYKVQLQSDSERLTASAQSLVEFVLKTVFHEGHQKLYKTYLETVTKQLMNQQTDDDVKDEISQSVTDKAKQQDSSQLPWLISNLFSNLFASIKPVKEKKTDCKLVVASKDAVLHFLPTFLKHAVHAWRKSPQQTFQLLIHVNSYLGFPVDSAEGKTEDSYVQTVVALLTVVHDSGVYNVAADRARGGAQLKYFRRMLQVLLKAEISSSLCRCLSVLLHLNHLILEPTMKQVLHFCCSQLTQLPVETRSSVDVFLSSLVSTYSQLHQVPKWFGFVLDLNAVAPQQLPSVLSLPAFRQQLHEVIQQLPQTTAVDVWSRLSSEVTSAYKAVTDGNDDADVREKLWSIVLLYHEFISYVRLYDSSVTARIVDKIQSLQADLELNIITPALKNIQQKGKKDILLTRSCLLLAVCLGNVKLMLALYRTSGASHQEFRITSADLPFSLQLHELLGKKKSLASDAVVRSLVDSLMVQRVQALEQEESTGVADRPELQSYFTFSEGMQEEALKVEWDGCVSHVDDERYQLSKLHQITHKSASLLPMMLEKNGADLPKLIVRVFAESDQKETPGRHTAYSVARHLLHETEAGNSQEFYQHPKKKKKTGSETLVPVLQSLGEEGISWTDLSHNSLGQEVDLTERGEEVLKREDLGTERSTGDDLCCLLMELLDASAGTSVFRVVKPHLLLNHLEKLCSQCQVEEGSPLGQLLKKTVATVMGDFQSVLELEGFFSELKKRLQEVSDKLQTRHAGDLNLASYRMLFTVTQYLLQETHWHLKRDFYRKDVQTASRSYFSSISAAIDTIVGTLQQLHSKGTKFALPCHLMQCLEAVTVQRSVDAASHDKDSILDRSHLDGVEFVLQHVINTLSQTEMSAETEKSVVKRKRKQDREDKSSVSPAKKVRVAGPDQEDSRRMLVSVGEGCLEAEGMEECVRDTLAVVATACDISLFADLMEGLVRDVSVDNLANPAMIQEAVAVWQKVIGCSRLTNEQRAVLERLSVKYLLQCVAVMTEISCFFQGLAQGVGVPILHSLAQMLTLERSLRHHANRDFLSSFNAVYDVLHAVLVHHLNTSVKVIHNVMAVASSLLKECIRNGDQDRLLAQPAYVDPMVKCANLVSRLLALLANHRTELHRVAVGIVSDYANGVKAVTLLPVVKKALLPGVYAFLDLCDKHATSHLRVMLPAGVREVFHLLHNDFLKYYKYTGKV
ncbi:hypothetical protein BaRGS_00035872 [Batillaria attramentaria]|uniref:Nucleolar 27S pre-rRNA processing Urb2/Npa2 C-terminal domain-containing protein n=1 Tax=Batillaria attramentaria TaxID=370345 RepID=A0ABD0JER6_9CAEN